MAWQFPINLLVLCFRLACPLSIVHCPLSPLSSRVRSKLIKLQRKFIFSTDIKPPFLLDFYPETPLAIDCSNYQADCAESSSGKSPEKRKQPKRAVKVPKIKINSQEDNDNVPRKVLIYGGNKFYIDRKIDRKLIWKCTTSRFTKCSAELTTKLNGSQINATGSHDHANNME